MPEEPKILLLSDRRRRWLFLSLVVVFLLALPAMIFYTTGYRISFADKETTIVTTGGIYITNNNLAVEVFLDEEQIDRPRLFRSAYYIQNIEAGKHRVVVQGEDLQTWVKELPVDPHIVIEAAAFNMPIVSLVRPITRYVTATGTPIVPTVASTTGVGNRASATEPVIVSTSTATSSLRLNEEYVFVSSLFGSTSTPQKSVFSRLSDGLDRFRFATTTQVVQSTTTEAVVERGDLRLLTKKQDVYAQWREDLDVISIPHYFCVVADENEEIAYRYGEHVADAVDAYLAATTSALVVDGNRLCRPEIQLNRLRQDVYFYDFYPGSTDLVILQLEDGLYVTEIDDRAWQNTQRIYTGTDFSTVIENDVIYINIEGQYYEVVTEID